MGRPHMPLKKKLIIVSDDDTKKYATYLMQLISSKDDCEEIVGIKDGSVDATIWSEKQYLDSLGTLTTSTYVLFVGNGKAAKLARENMQHEFDELGMHYGWLGTQGCMYVDDASLNRDNYPEFEALCDKYGKEFGGAIALLESKTADDDEAQAAASPAAEVIVEPVPDDQAEEADGPNAEHKGLVRVDPGAFARKAIAPFKAVARVAYRATVRVGALVSSREARDRQYTVLALVMYRDGLSRFLGEK